MLTPSPGRVVQAVPLSLFKVWPFASCGEGANDVFEVCPCDINSRKVKRNLLPDGELSSHTA